MLGAITPEQTEMFMRNPRFMGLKFPDMSRPETLEKRYVGKLPKRYSVISRVNGRNLCKYVNLENYY